MMRKGKKFLILLIVVAIITAAVGGFVYFNKNYVLLSGIQSRRAIQLDLSGKKNPNLEKLAELTQLQNLDLRNTGIGNKEFEQVQMALPGCDIHWSVPFQASFQDSKSQSLTVSALTVEDISQLTYFTNLQMVNITGCCDLPVLAALTEAYPDLDISYQVSLAGGAYPHNTTEMTLSDVDAAQLLETLEYLPLVKRVELQGKIPQAEELLNLIAVFPNTDFSWQREVFGVKADNETTELTLTDVNTDEIPILLAELAYLPMLEKVNLEGSLPEASALQQMCVAYPEIKFYWQIELFGITADVNTVELDFSEIPMESVDTVENALGYLPSLEKVIMSNCGISNEDMDALWKRNPEVRFIWTVQVGAFSLRTDETAFMPGKYKMLPKDDQCYNLRYCVDMECLDLGHCDIDDCEFVAFMPNLKYLLLALTDISDISPIANHDKLIYLELFTCPNLKDYTPLLTLKNLEDLNICYTDGDIEIIAQMTWLKNLWWSAGKDQKYIARKRYEVLSVALPNTYLELDTQSSTGEGWRKLPHYYEQRDIFEMPYFVY